MPGIVVGANVGVIVGFEVGNDDGLNVGLPSTNVGESDGVDDGD